jgi:myo-inositol 2-dehydrogenase/D-chiro-inositol 1-dehydrogenase
MNERIFPISRRTFVKTASLSLAAASLSSPLFGQSIGKRTIKVAVVGCGGRGTFMLGKFIAAATILDRNVEVVAVADAFEDKATALGLKHTVPGKGTHWGFDSYQKVMASTAEYVILATPPNFRPLHLEAAVNAGKHIFLEKPIAVDGPGIRKVIELGETAKGKGLAVVAGVQRRHDINYQRNKALIDAGAVGQIVSGFVSWSANVPWFWSRQPGWSDADYLARNWLNFLEMSGDHIVEQHVHNLDVANWFIGRVPVAAVGFGGRARRQTGNQYDFFAIDYDYGDGVRVNSQCCQISGNYNRIGEFFRGTEGEVYGGGKLTGKEVAIPELRSDSPESTVQEMVDLIRSVEKDQPLNTTQIVAEATATAVLGRIAAYTGKMVRWRDLMVDPKSPFYNLQVGPDPRAFETGAIQLPVEGVAPLPGDGGPIRDKAAPVA